MTGGHFGGIDAGRVAVPADLPAPPTRTINMSRLGEALRELDDPPVPRSSSSTRTRPPATPTSARVHAGLAREDLFTVVLEQRLTDTARYADVVLPATMQPEHLDLHDSYGHHYVTLNLPAVEPPGRVPAEHRDLPPARAARSGSTTRACASPTRRSCARRARLPEPRARPASRSSGCATRARCASTAPGLGALRRRRLPDAERQLRLLAPELAEQGADPLVGYVPPHELEDAELAKRYPLALLSPRRRFFLNSTFASLPWHRDRLGPPRVHLHPRDAADRGIESGARVRVHNDRGAFTAEAVIDDAAQPGRRVHLQEHWPQLLGPGEHVNVTIPERDADLGGSPTFHDNRVEVSLAPDARSS